MSLEEGPNIITVYVIDEDGQTLSVEKTVTTSDETFEEDTVSEPSEN